MLLTNTTYILDGVFEASRDAASYLSSAFAAAAGLPWEDVIFRIEIISAIITLLLIIGAVYVLLKLFSLMEKHEIRAIPKGMFGKTVFTSKAPGVKAEFKSERWDEIKKRLDSENPSEWKLAIVDADTLIDNFIKELGYQGETFGERLKRIGKGFKGLDELWRAHKIRNRIVHEPDIKISKDSVRKVLSLYEKAVKELQYI